MDLPYRSSWDAGNQGTATGTMMPVQRHLAAVNGKRRRSFDDGIGAMPRQRTVHHIADAGNADTVNDMQWGRTNDDSAVCGFIAQANDGESHEFESSRF